MNQHGAAAATLANLPPRVELRDVNIQGSHSFVLPVAIRVEQLRNYDVMLRTGTKISDEVY